MQDYKPPSKKILLDHMIYQTYVYKHQYKFDIIISDEGSSFLSFLKGDLIILEDDNCGETVLSSGWSVGRCILSLILTKYITEMAN